MNKTNAAAAFKSDYTLKYMNPDKPIVLTMKGLFPNKILDDYMMRTKEIMYQIYSENLMPFDKSVVISMEAIDESQNTQ